MLIEEKLGKVWPLIKWMDDARWVASTSGSIIPGEVFQSISPSQKILSHWLCYITDQQRPWQKVWNDGCPINTCER